MNKPATILTLLFLIPISVWAQIPIAAFNAPSSACIGEKVTFENQSTSSGDTYVHWIFGDGYDSGQNPIAEHIYSEAGTYTVKLEVQNSEGYNSTESQIMILPVPEMTLDFSRELVNDTISMYIGQQVSADAIGDLSSFKWQRFVAPEWVDLSTESSLTTSTGGSYRIWAKGTEGCATQDDFWIVTSPRPDAVTQLETENNILTPNNDGINDYLLVKYIEDIEIIKNPVVLKIFNKQGVLVYENIDYQNRWEGKNTGGDELGTGTYYYILQSEGLRGKTGFIDIIRSE